MNQVSLKIIMVGDSAVGKSSLVKRFNLGASYSDLERPGYTVGVDYCRKEMTVENYNVKLQIWDTAGQERYRSLVSTYYRNADGVVAVYDVTDRKTFQNLEFWLKTVKCDPCPPVIILVGNKIDRERREITRSEGLQYSKDKGVLFMETSVLIGHGIPSIFEKLVRKILQNGVPVRRTGDDLAFNPGRGNNNIQHCLCGV